MREDFKKYSWTLYLVIIAFVGGFVLTDAFGKKKDFSSDLITVDGEVVVEGNEYQRLLQQTLQRYKSQNLNKAMITQFRVPEQVFRSLDSTAIMRVQAKKMGITASREELKLKIITNPNFQREGKFIGRKNYERLLAQNRIHVEDFESQLRDEVIREKFRYLVTNAVVMDQESLKEEFVKEKDKAEIDYMRLNVSRIKDEIKLEDTDPSIKEYYEKNKEDFKSAETRAGYVIAYKFDDYKKEIVVPEKEVYDFFIKNKINYVVKGKTKVSRIMLKYGKDNRDAIYKKAEALKKELTAENFAEKAKTVSEDDKAKQGGDHGYFAWKQFTKQEVSIIESLSQGKISTLIDAQTGFSLLYIPEKIKDKPQVFNDVKAKIRDNLETEKVTALVTEKLAKIYKKLSDSDDIKTKAAGMNISVIETELLANGKPIKDIDQMGYISRKLFSMKENAVESPVNFVKGLAIVQLTKIEEPVVEPFETVKAKVKTKVISVKKVDMLLEKAKTYVAELNRITDEKKREKYLKDNDLKFDFATYKKGNKLASLPEKEGLDATLFAAPLKQVSGPLRYDSEVVVYKLKNKTITTDADFDKERSEYYKKKVEEQKSSYFAAYIANLRKSVDVRHNLSLFEEIKENVMSRFN